MVAVLVIIWQVIVFLRSLRKTPLPMLAVVVPATEYAPLGNLALAIF